MADVSGREDWTEEERELFDARADHEERTHAMRILAPMAAISREVGNPALERVMDRAVADVEGEANRALAALADLEARYSKR